MYSERIISRFWQKVDCSGECWLWTAGLLHGYGWVGTERGNRAAHRVSWEIHFGPVPDGLCVLHDCPGGDNRACVNPAHLWLGTRADNNADKVRKVRQPWGKACHFANLTEDDVREIRALIAISEPYNRKTGISAIARRFGVDPSTIGDIRDRITWAHLD